MINKNNYFFSRFKGMDLVEALFYILNSLHEGVIVIDKEGTIIYANPSYTRILGVPIEKILGKNLYDIEPDTKSLNVLRTQQPIIGEYEVAKSLGKNVIFDSSGIFVNGEMVGVVSIFRDITDTIKLNQKLEYYRNYAMTLKKQKLSSRDNLPEAFKSIIGNDLSFVQVLQYAAKVAQTDAATLLEGESGSGKELFAKAIHGASMRRNKPMIIINCAAIPEPLFESELFGYEEGAFTGAKKHGKKGKFELADQGTIFLDEIGELPLHMQAKLLRALQEGKIDPIGSTKPIPVNVRIIAATNKNLANLVELGKFRRDLFFRLNVIIIKIPPLREHPNDIPVMAEEFLKKINKPRLQFSFEVIKSFYKYPWPGNIRELENIVKHAAIICEGKEITMQDLPDYFHEEMLKLSTSVYEKNVQEDPEIKKYIADAEKQAILDALKKCNNNRSKAMRLLGVSRGTFYKKLKKYHI